MTARDEEARHEPQQPDDVAEAPCPARATPADAAPTVDPHRTGEHQAEVNRQNDPPA